MPKGLLRRRQIIAPHPNKTLILQGGNIGCDGIVVSNHGGRQVAFGPPMIKALPPIAEAVGGRIKIILDSGIRRGTAMMRAKALGADFPFAGRAMAQP